VNNPASNLEEVELDLAPNGPDIKVRWKISGPAFSKPLRISAPLLKKRSKEVRSALDSLNQYVKTNHDLDAQRDPGWTNYSQRLQILEGYGRGLFAALFPPDNPEARQKAEELRNLPKGTRLKVYCSDSEVSLPLGFINDGEISLPTTGPSLDDFAAFWLSRFEITMHVDGCGCDNLAVDPEKLKALYALHEKELLGAANWLGEDHDKLTRLLTIPAKDHYNWASVKKAWDTIRDDDNIIFVLAHSDGDWLLLSETSQLDCNSLLNLLHKPRSTSTLLILNCCLSAQGGEGASLLSVIARQGFCGLVGTEAEILNTYALRCGVRLMWDLCAKGLSLGQAFAAMQSDKSLFPLNLFYTCYADREFRLNQPITDLSMN